MTDHPFTPQPGSNMCVCGLAIKQHCPVGGDHMLAATEAACASCGSSAEDDNELLADDEGTVICEACWQP